MNERFNRAALIARVNLAHEPDFTLGHLQVRPARREIVGPAWQEMLEPRVMQVLVALARAKGEIFSRDDLIESCWEGVIVGEDAINRCIGRLRKVAEASGNAFSIETVSRVGYRLKTVETPVAVPEPRDSAEPTVDPGSAPTEPIISPPASAASLGLGSVVSAPASKTVPARWSIAAAAAVVLAAALGIWRLWPLPAAPAESAASVAVLPFVNMSGDPAKEYFSDGFSEELLNDLSNDSRLRVAASTSAFAFKGKNEDIQTIARALHVGAIVAGSVREAGNRVRVAAQLINANNGYNIWSATYDRNLSDILSLQNELARNIAVALTHKLVPATQHRKIEPLVYRQYLEGRQQLNRQSLDGSRKAFALFREVAANQPDFADGFAALAHAAFVLATFDPEHANAYIAASNEAAQKALMLDSRNIEGRVQREILELVAWNWSGAAADMKALWNQNPNELRVLAGSRIYFNQMGFPDEASAAMRRSIALNPLASAESFILIRNLLHDARYDEAIDVSRALLVHEPRQPRALGGLCAAYARKGDIEKARALARQLGGVSSEGVVPSDIDQCDFEIDLATGSLADARKIVASWESEFPDKLASAVDIAERYVELNDFDRAGQWYERGYERREFGFFRTVYWIGGAKYRATPRWKALTEQPAFKEWQAEHDRIAADLAAHPS